MDAKSVIGGVVGAVILILAAAALYPTLATAGSSLNTALGGGLGVLFTGTILGLIFAAAIFYGCYKMLHK